MPKFEEENTNASNNKSVNYTPSTDAFKKPRTRRGSGGFKTEVPQIDTSKMGEISATEALKIEKLSAKPQPAKPQPAKPQRERENKPRREPPRKSRQKGEPRSDTNPQPSAETLAAIARVEAKIATRRAERDATQAKHTQNRPAKGVGSPSKKSHPTRQKPAPTQSQTDQGGLRAVISKLFGKLFGSPPEPAPKKKAGSRDGQSRQAQQGSQGGRRDGRGGARNGQNRKRGGKDPRRNSRRSNKNNEA